MEAAVRYILLNNVDFAALAVNVYPETIPQGAAFPAMFYQVLNRRPLHSKSENCGYDVWTIRFTIYAEKYNQISTISKALIKALDHYPRGVVQNIWIDSIRLDDERGGYEDNAQAYRRIIDFEIITKT